MADENPRIGRDAAEIDAAHVQKSPPPTLLPSTIGKLPRSTRWPSPPRKPPKAFNLDKKTTIPATAALQPPPATKRGEKEETPTAATADDQPTTAAMAGTPSKIVPLFIASIGNPAPTYANTLHSAGHTALEQIRKVRGFAPFRKDSAAGAAGRGGLITRQGDPVAPGFSWLPGILAAGASKTDRLGREPVKEGEEDWTLWQSTSLMNVSGKGLGQAYTKWKRANKEGQLVVLHDELEKALGKATVRRGGSARGHNGLKSINAQLNNMPYARIGIGIGRPASREPDDVAKYVLRKMTDKEQYVIEGMAGEIIELLRDIQEGKR